jgi:hypothetical protein
MHSQIGKKNGACLGCESSQMKDRTCIVRLGKKVRRGRGSLVSTAAKTAVTPSVFLRPSVRLFWFLCVKSKSTLQGGPRLEKRSREQTAESARVSRQESFHELRALVSFPTELTCRNAILRKISFTFPVIQRGV